MTRSLAVAAAALLSLPLAAHATDYTFDPAHTQAGFSVKHMMVTTVHGRFGKVSGTLSYDAKNPKASTVEAILETASISTDNEKRDAHLKSPDFFDAEKNPTVTFKSSKVETAGKNKLKVTGDLTMHGITKPVVLDVEGPTAPVKDPYGNEKIGATASTKVSRKEFGLNWNKALEAGGVMVGDEVTITLELEAAAKKVEAAK